MSKNKSKKWTTVSKNGCKRVICDISEGKKSLIEVKRVDDYFLHKNNDITIGKEFHKKLLEKYSKKLRKTGEIESNINLTDLKSKFKLDIRPLNEGIDRIQDFIIKKSETSKTTDLKKVCMWILNIS